MKYVRIIVSAMVFSNAAFSMEEVGLENRAPGSNQASVVSRKQKRIDEFYPLVVADAGEEDLNFKTKRRCVKAATTSFVERVVLLDVTNTLPAAISELSEADGVQPERRPRSGAIGSHDELLAMLAGFKIN